VNSFRFLFTDVLQHHAASTLRVADPHSMHGTISKKAWSKLQAMHITSRV